MSDNYVGTSEAFEDGNGDGTTVQAVPSMVHAWIIIVGSLALLWLLGGVVFKTVRI